MSHSRAVSIGDFNQDGKLDWVVGNIGEPNQLFLGDGKGGVESDFKFGEKEGETYCLAVADLDLDGDLDFVAGNVGQPNNAFYNEGNGARFRMEVLDAENNATYGISVGDLSGDGAPDVAVANSDAPNRIFLARKIQEGTAAEKQTQRDATESKGSPLQSADLTAFQSRSEYHATDWPAFRGTGGRGVAEGFSLPTNWNADSESGDIKNVVWQVDVPGLGHSSPVVSGNKLFLLTAVAEDGAAPLVVQSGGRPTAADDNGVQAWILLCYDKTSGKELWTRTLRQAKPRATRHAKATHANTSVCVSGDKVITFLGSEGLYCHQLDGTELWKQDLGVINISKYGIGWGFSSSPSVHGDHVVLVCDDPEAPFLTCRRLSDGEEVWRTSRKDISERSWGTPLVHQSDEGDEDAQVVVNGFPWIVSYRLSDGKEVWRIKGGGDNPVPSPFEAIGLIFITNAHGGPSPIFAVRPNANGELDGENESIAWSTGKGGSYMSTPVVYGEHIYFGNSNGVVRMFHSVTGKKLAERRLGSKAGVIASLVAGDGKIYCASENGTVYVLQYGPEMNIVAENSMGSPCLATPAISAGTIYVRTTNRLTAITLSKDAE